MYKALGSKEYRLHSMVCYYGSHYHAFVHTEGRWVAFRRRHPEPGWGLGGCGEEVRPGQDPARPCSSMRRLSAAERPPQDLVRRPLPNF